MRSGSCGPTSTVPVNSRLDSALAWIKLGLASILGVEQIRMILSRFFPSCSSLPPITRSAQLLFLSDNTATWPAPCRHGPEPRVMHRAQLNSLACHFVLCAVQRGRPVCCAACGIACMGDTRGGIIFGKDAETHGRRANGMHAMPCSFAHIMRFRCYTTNSTVLQPSQNTLASFQ